MAATKPTAQPPRPRGSGGSFWITREAIEVLLANQATATEIAAYLILARFTDETGQFSTAGMQAIYKNIGIGQDVAKRAVGRLCKMLPKPKGKRPSAKDALVHPAEAWAAADPERVLPQRQSELSMVRWVLNGYMAGADGRVWMSNELVDGIGKFTQPMKRLKRSGDVAARILLMAYREQDLERFGGIDPSTMFYDDYTMTRIVHDLQGGYDLWHGEHENGYVMQPCSKPTLGIDDWPKDADKKQELVNQWFRAMKALDSAGFIYQVVSVLDREPDHAEAQVVYELTAKLSGLLGKPVTDSMGRFYDKYAAIVPAGIETHIIGIWRLRFRVSNPKNHGVRGAWARIHRGQDEALDWLKDLAEQYHYSKQMGFELTGEQSEDELDEGAVAALGPDEPIYH